MYTNVKGLHFMKKIISLLLALLMILSSAALLFSCSEKEEEDTGSKGEVKTYDEDSIFYERSLEADNLPEKDFGGRVFRVVANSSPEFFIEEEERNQGDLLKDAKFARNETVENRFNVKIEVVYHGTYSEEADYVSKTVLSGNDEFDLFAGMVMSMGGMVTKKLFLNWYDVPHIDFSKPWWYESNSTDLTYNGKAPIAISHLNQSAVSGAYCLYFNKNLASSYELGDLYGLVLDGKWTFDKLSEMVKDIYVDDGNDARDANDFYGFAQINGTAINSYLWAFDNPVCAKDEEGVPQIAVNTSQIDSIVSSLYDFCFNNNGVYFDPTTIDLDNKAPDLFYAGKSIFTMGSVGSASSKTFRDLEFDYGLIPLPKFTEDQKSYKTMVGGHHTALAVPKTARDLEFIGTITEALSAESWKTVTPTLYEIALKTRYLRDAESKKIMDLVIDGTQFDFGTVYDNWQGFAFMIQRLMGSKNSNFQSYYKTQYSKARYQIKATVKAIDKI